MFDPACGSGNFLVIAYIQMREIEAEIIQRRRDDDKKSWIKLANFYGIEIKDFAVEIARLALLIAEFQCDVRMIGQQEARSLVLPLKKTGQITCGNALRLDWLQVCPPAKPVEHQRKDLFDDVPEQVEVDFDAVEPETYICGNPPFTGAREQSISQKEDLRQAMSGFAGVNSLDYVCGWVWKAVKFGRDTESSSAFVATNSLCQGQSIPLFWGSILGDAEIFFAYLTFKWQNNATNNAAVHCVIVGLARSFRGKKLIFDSDTSTEVANISPYLTNNKNVIVRKTPVPLDERPELVSGNQAIDGGHLILSKMEMHNIIAASPNARVFFRPLYGADDFVQNVPRYCIWVKEEEVFLAAQIPEFQNRFDLVREYRRNAGEVASSLVHVPFRFRYVHEAKNVTLVVPRTTTDRREYIPIGLLLASAITTDAVQVIYDPENYILSVLSSKLHMRWIKAVAGRLKSDPRWHGAAVYVTRCLVGKRRKS